jgi:hypothetical protein
LHFGSSREEITTTDIKGAKMADSIGITGDCHGLPVTIEESLNRPKQAKFKHNH